MAAMLRDAAASGAAHGHFAPAGAAGAPHGLPPGTAGVPLPFGRYSGGLRHPGPHPPPPPPNSQTPGAGGAPPPPVSAVEVPAEIW